MIKYNPLFNYLNGNEGTYIKLNFEDIERIISNKLPTSASKYRA